MIVLGRYNRWRPRVASIITALMLAMFMPSHVLAQTDTLSELRLGVIDMQNVIQRSNAMSVIRSALDEQNAAFQSAVSEEELQLRQAERELNANQETLSKSEFEKQLKQFEERVIVIQRSIQNQKISFDRSIQQAQTQLEQELLRIVSEIAQQRKLSMVMQRQNVVIYNNNLDITEEALTRLNDRTKNMKLTRQDAIEN